MKAIIIEDETAALSSLKAVLQQNSVVEIEVIAELESIEDSVEWFQARYSRILFLWIFIWRMDWRLRSSNR